MFCSKCGQENDDGAKFCSSCGNVVGSDVEKSAEQKAEDIKQKSKESVSTLFYLIKPLLKLKVLVPVVVIVLGIVFYPTMKSSYDNYQYEKEKLAKEKRETFVDSQTGLMWQDDSYMPERDWEGAKNYCNSLEYAGYSDWRLPNIEELKSIIDKSNTPAIITGFENVASYYWSSTTYVGYENRAWYVYIYYGGVHDTNKDVSNYVRCVRGRQ